MHCYRMLGPFRDEEALQDTLLTAWQGTRRVRGPRLASHLALPDRYQPVPQPAEGTPALDGSCQPPPGAFVGGAFGETRPCPGTRHGSGIDAEPLRFQGIAGVRLHAAVGVALLVLPGEGLAGDPYRAFADAALAGFGPGAFRGSER